jgi:hypothetical protein
MTRAWSRVLTGCSTVVTFMLTSRPWFGSGAHSLVHINTLLLQAVLEVSEFHDLIGPNERRGLTPLFWSNINPYGRFRLDMDSRLDLAASGAAAVSTVESVL